MLFFRLVSELRKYGAVDGIWKLYTEKLQRRFTNEFITYERKQSKVPTSAVVLNDALCDLAYMT